MSKRCLVSGLIPALFLSIGTAALAVDHVSMFTPSTLEDLSLQVVEEPPMRLVELAGAEPMATLSEARLGAADQIEAISEWNKAGRLPMKIGMERPLPLPQTVDLGASALSKVAGAHAGGAMLRTSIGDPIWGTEVRVDQSFRLRLRLDEVSLPLGTKMWVYAENGESFGPFGLELMDPEGGLWTPSVAGPALRLEVVLPAVEIGKGDWSFRLGRVIEAVQIDHDGSVMANGPGLNTKMDISCLTNVACVPSSVFGPINSASRGVAQLQFFDGGSLFVCSGGLLNDRGNTQTPFFLTANHCFDNQTAASSLEAFWDRKADTCGGVAAPASGFPRSSGATLLATKTETDFTLVRFNSVPSGRTFLGWDARNSVVTVGKVLHRLSHPAPSGPQIGQQYTRYEVISVRNACPPPAGRPINDTNFYLHSMFQEGGTFGGSSGAPLLTGDGSVVGQLFGACGLDPSAGCSSANDELDGAFKTTYNDVKQFIDPDTGGGGGGPNCPGGNAGWIQDSAFPDFCFKATINPAGGGAPITGVKESTCLPETVCVSGQLAGRTEALMRVIGPRGNGKLWPTLIKFTTSQVVIEVGQKSTGATKMYTLRGANPNFDELPGLFDRDGFVP